MKQALLLLVSVASAGNTLADDAATNAKPPVATKSPAKKVAAPAPSANPSAVPGGMPQSFVIPANTCEQGTPLQKLLRDKPKEVK